MMIQINFCQPSSIILADLEQHVVMSQVLESALLALGIELRWEHHGEYEMTQEGFWSYHDLGRKLVQVFFVGPPIVTPETYTEQEAM